MIIHHEAVGSYFWGQLVMFIVFRKVSSPGLVKRVVQKNLGSTNMRLHQDMNMQFSVCITWEFESKAKT